MKGEEVGVAVCGLRTVKAHSMGEVEMCLTWDMPIIHFGANGKRYARYTDAQNINMEYRAISRQYFIST